MSSRFLYYNPNVAVHPSTHHLPGMARFSQFFKIYNPSVVLIDRTGTITTPIRTEALFPIPAFKPSSTSFEDICNERANELLKRADRLNVRLYVFWSGGIDSTLVLISLLKSATPEQKKRIVVLMNEESIDENPNFYREHVQGRMTIESSTMFPYLLGGPDIFVGGEHNDQLFGSDMVGQLIVRYGAEAIHRPYSRDTFFEFFNEALNDPAGTNFYLDLFERLAKAAPIPIVSNFDLLWWINFSLKWQCVFMRMLSRTVPRNVGKITKEYIQTNYIQFYGTDAFQLWSLNNQDKKIKDAWNTYKWPCKEIIYNYTKDADYRDNKTKRGSLHFLLLQQRAFNFINDQLEFSFEETPSVYYKAVNDFI